MENETELCLRDLLINTLLKWRVILIVAIASLFVSAVYGGVTFAKKIKYDKEATMQRYEMEKIAYDAKLSMLKDSIQNTKKEESRLSEYNENSIKMKVNPLDCPTGNLSIYISTDYQIMPDKTYQNTDITQDVVGGYVSYLNSGSMFKKLADILGEDIEFNYLKELCEVSVEEKNSIIDIKVIGEDNEKCEKMLSGIWTLLEKQKDELSQNIGEHKLAKIEEAVVSAVDLNLGEYQKKNIQTVSELRNDLLTKTQELDSFWTVSSPVLKITTRDLVMHIVKKALLGFGIGFAAILVLVSFSVIVSKKVNSIDEFSEKFSMPILGKIYKKRNSRIDCWIRNGFKKQTNDQTMEHKIMLLVETVTNMVEANETQEGQNSDTKLLLMGTMITPQYNELLKQVGSIFAKHNIKCELGTSIQYDIETLHKVRECDYVVLFEQFNKSTYTAIKEELEQIKFCGKKVLGTVVYNI